MPINVYTGLMRSGKSYEVVSTVILDAIEHGRRVVTNVDGIDNDLIQAYVADKRHKSVEELGEIKHVTNEDVFRPDFLPYYDEAKTAHTDTIVQPGDLVAIDEAWRFWGTDCKLLKQHKSFFLEHGHFTHPDSGVACDLVLMIQDMGTLHRFVKSVVAFSFRTHKKVSLGLNNTYSLVMWEGSKMNRQTRIGEWVRRYNKDIFPLYSSFTGGAEGKTVNIDKRQNIFANPRLWIVVAVCVLGGAWGFRNVWKFFHPAGSTTLTKTPGAGSTTQASNPSGQGQAKAGIPPAPSAQWRIAGHYQHGMESWVVLSDSTGRIRMESPSVVTGSGLLAVGIIDGQLVTPYSGGSIMVPQGEKK